MKKDFFNILLELMAQNNDIYVLFCGLGYPRFEEFKSAYPDRVFNTEASEQASLDIACGLAVMGKIPFVYSITPFVLWRAAETIRTYIDHEMLNVKLVGAGRGDDYTKHDGFSHDAADDKKFISLFEHIDGYWPDTTAELYSSMQDIVSNKSGCYLNIKR